MVVVVSLVIAMNIYTHLSIGHVMRKLGQGLRLIWRDPEHRLPRDSASAIGAINWAPAHW